MTRPFILSALLTLSAASSFAQTPTAPPPPGAAAPQQTAEVVAPDSPRAAISHFLTASRSGNWAEAARDLDVPEAERDRAPQLARRLKAVLDRHTFIDLTLVSPASGGQPGDGLPPGVDDVATVPGEGGRPEPVRMVRQEGPDGSRWVISRGTVVLIDPWYEQLDNRWFIEHLPEPLLRTGPRGLMVWQWLALPLLLAACWLLGRFFSWGVRRLLAPLFARTKATWDDELLQRLGRPATLLGALLALKALYPSLLLTPTAENLIDQLFRAGLVITFFWALLRSVDVGVQLIRESTWIGTHPAALGLLPLGARTLKITGVTIGMLTVVSELGYPVASLLAGLGIGGLAVALAAQKTVENLLGSVAISVDQPFRVGDWVKVEGSEGTVEYIGLRSTRIRTNDRTVISFPNGKLADLKIESFGPRDRILMRSAVALAYDTPAASVKQVIEALQAYLNSRTDVSPLNAPVIRLSKFGPLSIEIEILVWFKTSDWATFLLAREEVLLGFMQAVEKTGAKMAGRGQSVVLADR